MPSISRSGGDNAEGDSLKDYEIQERYWKMVQERIQRHWKEFPSRTDGNSQTERESNLLLLLRKLREGILSSQRKDELALEVYETSFYLAVIFESSVQASSSLSHLPVLFSSLLSSLLSTETLDLVRSRAEALATVALVFLLSETFPSQIAYYSTVRSFTFVHAGEKEDSAALRWASSILAVVNCRNYALFEVLTRESWINSVIKGIRHFQDKDDGVSTASNHQMERDYVRVALFSAVNALRRKLRNVAWSILRSAYRELALDANTDTAAWLSRSLLLKPVGEGLSMDAEEWIEQRGKDGHVVRKEGLPGRWFIKR